MAREKAPVFSLWALLFGPIWFIGNGMWTRGTTLLMLLGLALYASGELGFSPIIPLAAINLFSALTADSFRKEYVKKKDFK